MTKIDSHINLFSSFYNNYQQISLKWGCWDDLISAYRLKQILTKNITSFTLNHIWITSNNSEQIFNILLQSHHHTSSVFKLCILLHICHLLYKLTLSRKPIYQWEHIRIRQCSYSCKPPTICITKFSKSLMVAILSSRGQFFSC